MSVAERRAPDEGGSGWKVWLATPWRAAAAALVLAAGGLLFGHLAVLLFVFPPQGVATDLVRVPELVGRTADEAREALERRGLQYLEMAAFHHPDAPAGVIVAQDPLPEQLARPGSAVQVTLSAGTKELPLPDVIGLSRRQAEIALERAGLRTDVTWLDAEEPVGEIVGTDPAPGTRIAVPGLVHLEVSAGPPRIEVPDLRTRALPEARALLERLGLRLGTVARDWASQAAPGTVLDQSPRPGTLIDRGAQVSVTVAVVAPPSAEPADTPGVRGTTGRSR